MYELVNKKSFVNFGAPAGGTGNRRHFSLVAWKAESRSALGTGAKSRGGRRSGAWREPWGGKPRGLRECDLGGGGASGAAGRGCSGVVMAAAALDAVRRELREFPAAVRGEWVCSVCGVLALAGNQCQDAGGAVGMAGTGFRSLVAPVLPGRRRKAVPSRSARSRPRDGWTPPL